MTTLFDLMLEMGTWVRFSDEDLIKAKDANINTSNNREFNTLVLEWGMGTYDEDVDELADTLRRMVNERSK